MTRPRPNPRGGAAARAAAATTALALALPASASAHGLVGKQDLPVPQWLFAWAAGVVLIASFVGLATLWPTPRLEPVRERVVATFPRAVEVVCGAVGIAVFVLLVYAGFAGAQDDQSNIVPTSVFVIFWVGVPFASLLFGDVFRAFSPWRAVGRATGWLVGAVGAPPQPVPYPERLGRWPAVVGIVGFAWLELVYPHRTDPSTLATLMLVYAALQLIGMSLYGERAWTRWGDGFGVFFAFVARLSPLDWSDRQLRLRRPLSGTTTVDMVPGTVMFICALIGTTSFDGFSQGTLWSSLQSWALPQLHDLGPNGEQAGEILYTFGLLAAVAIVFGLYRLGIEGIRGVDRARGPIELSRLFAHSLIPIAMAYVVAHYFSLLGYQGQAIWRLASDPLGDGSDLFGTAHATIDYTWIGATGVWYVQVAALVAGHVIGLVLAHDRAIATYSNARVAARSQYWMLGVMVCFTCLALYLLSAAAQ